MDLSLIQTHLDNFVTTWEGWNKVVTGIKEWGGLSSAWESTKGAFETAADALPALSSK